MSSHELPSESGNTRRELSYPPVSIDSLRRSYNRRHRSVGGYGSCHDPEVGAKNEKFIHDFSDFAEIYENDPSVKKTQRELFSVLKESGIVDAIEDVTDSVIAAPIMDKNMDGRFAANIYRKKSNPEEKVEIPSTVFPAEYVDGKFSNVLRIGIGTELFGTMGYTGGKITDNFTVSLDTEGALRLTVLGEDVISSKLDELESPEVFKAAISASIQKLSAKPE